MTVATNVPAMRFCPKCGGRTVPNARIRLNPKAPAHRCVEPGCDGVLWATPEERELMRGHLSNEPVDVEAERIADGAFPQISQEQKVA